MVVHAKYSEIIDLNTTVGSMTVIGIHSPIGDSPRNKLSGLFFNFRKYKYLGCRFSMAPAAQLPVDPLGVGVEAGQATMDPRDLLNPILFHGAHGENINAALNVAYRSSGAVGDSLNTLAVPFDASTNYLTSIAETNYYSALSDPTWKKYSIMSPFTVKLHPLVHKMATIAPIPNMDIPNVDSDGSSTLRSGSDSAYKSEVYGLQSSGLYQANYNALPQQIITNGVTSLGWMECVTKRPFGSYQNGIGALPRNNYLPRCYMGIVILPPAYSVRQAFRIVVDHYFVFDDLTVNNQISVEHGGVDDTYTDTLSPEMKPGTSTASITTNAEANLVTEVVS